MYIVRTILLDYLVFSLFEVLHSYLQEFEFQYDFRVHIFVVETFSLQTCETPIGLRLLLSKTERNTWFSTCDLDYFRHEMRAEI
jgi:hypothetical protein